jgi:exosortase/archaeosortase family protein
VTSVSLPSGPPLLTRARVRAWIDVHSFRLRLTAALLAIAVAYNYSLLTLVRALGLDTPLAYLGLVPVIALGLALARARPSAHEPAIHDREIDYIVGLPFLAVAGAILWLLPRQLHTVFWVYRVDLLSLPFFVSGVVTLLFGVRSLWRLRLPIVFLLLAWPLPYTAFLSRWLDGFTELTIRAVGWCLGFVHVAKHSPGSDGSLFAISHQGHPFVLSVASSCSGVNGVVGFLLVGIAFSLLVQGRRTVKVVWLLSGAMLVWGLNIARLLLIFWAGSTWGESVAVDGLHPVIGVLLFAAGVAAMVASMRPLGLSIPSAPTTPVVRAAVPHHRVAVPRVGAAGAILLSLTLMLGVANAGMRSYQLVAGDLGSPRLESFTTSPAVVPGFSASPVATYPWARRFFGNDSTWNRYSYVPTGGIRLVTADVISTSSLGRFSDYGIEACYRFHGYDVTGRSTVDLGHGVTGNVLTYTNGSQQLRWSVVYWIWPVKSAHGTRFERIALLVPSQRNDGLADAQPRTDPVRGLGGGYLPRKPATSAATSLTNTRSFLASFATALVASRTPLGKA